MHSSLVGKELLKHEHRHHITFLAHHLSPADLQKVESFLVHLYSSGIQSPKLRMVSWNLNTMRFVSVIGHPNHQLRI